MPDQEQQNLATDFEGDPMDSSEVESDINEGDTQVEAEAARDVDGVPYCCDHHCRMKVSSSGKAGSPTTYYKCPVRGCKAKGQVIKTTNENVVPPTPVTCPRCSKPKKGVTCVRNKQLSTAAYVIVQCPDCEWKSSALASPTLAAQHSAGRNPRRRRPDEGIGDR